MQAQGMIHFVSIAKLERKTTAPTRRNIAFCTFGKMYRSCCIITNENYPLFCTSYSVFRVTKHNCLILGNIRALAIIARIAKTLLPTYVFESHNELIFENRPRNVRPRGTYGAITARNYCENRENISANVRRPLHVGSPLPTSAFSSQYFRRMNNDER